jgi:hypothetical protein
MERVQMAGKDGDPEDDLELDPPVDAEAGQQDDQDQPDDTEQESDEPAEVDQVDASGEQDRQPDQERPSRGERRYQTLSNELKEARQRNEELNRRLDAVIAGQGRPQQGETPETRAQRLALLTPEERIQETLREDREQHRREMQSVQFVVQEGSDKAAFEAKATVDPLYEKWKPKVEAELSSLRAKGQNVEREKLMFYLIGANAVEARKQQAGRQRADARGRVTRQQTRPSNSGSDTTGTRRDRNTSLERRLENQSI